MMSITGLGIEVFTNQDRRAMRRRRKDKGRSLGEEKFK